MLIIKLQYQKKKKIFNECNYMGGISQDVKRLKIWDFYLLFFGFS